jgi:predicted hydrolase (HD superfamily)
MTRAEVLELLHEYTKTDSLRKHALSVETSMRAYAKKFGENEETFAIVGLLHDFDYEMFPTEDGHPWKGSEILKEKGISEEIRTAILGHAPYTKVPRESLLAKTLYACDELSGFIVACSLVRPNRIDDLETSSVKKKLKDKAFARTVNRDDIIQGAEELGVSLDEHISFLIDALRGNAKVLGISKLE